MITVIKIDVERMTVTIVDINNSLPDYYRHIGCKVMEAVRVGGLDPNDRLYVDEEGLLTPGKSFFSIEGYPQMLAGNGLIVGCDDNGESVSARTPFQIVRPRIKFPAGITT